MAQAPCYRLVCVCAGLCRARWNVGSSARKAQLVRSKLAYNVSSVCDVKNWHTPKFAMKHGFFVF